MKLWLFTFTQPDRVFLSARVASRTREEAVAVMARFLQHVTQTPRVLVAVRGQRPEPGTILTILGKIDVSSPGIVSVIKADGQKMVPA